MTAIGSATSSTVQQGASVSVARLAQNQQRAEGQASVSLIQSAGETQRAQSPSPQGPSPDGTGARVNVVA